jgi:hypothetical protein
MAAPHGDKHHELASANATHAAPAGQAALSLHA